MSALERLLASPQAARLGLCLLHLLWQGALVAVVLAVGLRFLRGRSANLRYVCATVALFVIAVLPVITFVAIGPPTPGPAAEAGAMDPGAAPAPPVTHAPSLTGDDLAVPTGGRTSPSIPGGDEGAAGGAAWRQKLMAWVRPALPYVSTGWLVGVLLMGLWRLAGWSQVCRLLRRGARDAPAALRARLTELASRLRISRPVRLLESGIADVPTLIGYLRPVVLMPASMLSGLSTEQLEAIFMHELAHIRRHDYLVNLLQVLIETLLFYHPAVWWVSQRIRAEREDCCDDVAVAASGDRIAYARALATMEELRPAPIGVLAASGGALLARVRRIVGLPAAQAGSPSGWPAAAVALVTAVSVGGLLLACTAPAPRGVTEVPGGTRITPGGGFEETFDDNRNWQFNGNYAKPNFADYPGIKGWENGTMRGKKHPNDRPYLNIADGIVSGCSRGYAHNAAAFGPTTIHRSLQFDGSRGFRLEFRAVSAANWPNAVTVFLLSDWKRGKKKLKYYGFRIYGESSNHTIDITSTALDSSSKLFYQYKAGRLVNSWHTYTFKHLASGEFQLFVDGKRIDSFKPPRDNAYKRFNRIAIAPARKGSKIDWVRLSPLEEPPPGKGTVQSVSRPHKPKGAILVGEEGGAIKNEKAGWDGDFSTFTEAASDGSHLRPITWETTEIYRIPKDAKNVRLHAKVECANWESSAGVYVYNYVEEEYELKIGGSKAGYGVHEQTVPLSAAHVRGGKVKVRALLFAKHSRRAYARYYESEILHGGPTSSPGPSEEAVRGIERTMRLHLANPTVHR